MAAPPDPVVRDLALRDVLIALYLAAATAVSWLLPERLWPVVCRTAARTLRRLTPSRTRDLARGLDVLIGTGIDDGLVDGIRGNVHLRNLQYLRVPRPGGWSPVLRLEGREHIDQALARGRGVIIWSSPLVFADLVTKMALAGAGFRLTHLSYYAHGFSPTRLGSRFLNPVATRAEGRFLAERLVMTREDTYPALRALAQRVRSNRVVSISAVIIGGQRSATVPFLGGTTTIAIGAPQLARRTGAALLPTFTIREDDGSFRTVVEAPIDVTGPDRSDAATTAVKEYARRLEAYVSWRPDQYAAFGAGRGVRAGSVPPADGAAV